MAPKKTSRKNKKRDQEKQPSEVLNKVDMTSLHHVTSRHGADRMFPFEVQSADLRRLMTNVLRT